MISARVALAFWLIPLFVAIALAARFVDSSNSHIAETSLPHAQDQQTESVETPKVDPSELAAITSLQAEIQALEERVKKREQVFAQRKKEKRFTETASLNNQGLDPEQWSNKGYNTPYESVETLIFSAAGGDLPTMIDSLVFSPESEALAKRLFESLPASIRREQDTPETVVATMTIDRVPLAHARVTAFKDITDEAREVFMVFTSNLDSPQPVRLVLAQLPDSTWKILVPPSAIREYAEQLGISLNSNKERDLE